MTKGELIKKLAPYWDEVEVKVCKGLILYSDGRLGIEETELKVVKLTTTKDETVIHLVPPMGIIKEF